MSYRVKHIPTGLYYCRSRDVKVKWTDKDGKLCFSWVKSNLSKKGKIYHEIPASSWYAGSIGNHIHLQQLIQKGLVNPYSIPWSARLQSAPISDWVVENMDEKHPKNVITFEEWWNLNYVKTGYIDKQPMAGTFAAAFKETAEKAWKEGFEQGMKKP